MVARVQKHTKARTLGPFEQVYELVMQIPPGKVLTYGAISQRLNRCLSAAGVGWALNGLKDGPGPYTSETVPWQRVINSKGTLSTAQESGKLGRDGRPLKLQQVLLEREGVSFRADSSVDLAQYLWKFEAD